MLRSSHVNMGNILQRALTLCAVIYDRKSFILISLHCCVRFISYYLLFIIAIERLLYMDGIINVRDCPVITVNNSNGDRDV